MPKPTIRKSNSAASVRALMILAFAILLFPLAETKAQMSSLNTISPYTMYGLGDMRVGGSAFSRTMGGVGVGYRNPNTYNNSNSYYNYLNPASLSSIPRQSALFNFGAEGQNFYLKNSASKTSYSTFNIHDVGLAVPLGANIGLGFSLNPVSSVGYNTRIIDDNPTLIEEVGSTVYDYAGDGGITQLTATIGAKVIGNLSLGVSMHYWFGSISREFNITMTPHLTSTAYRGIMAAENTNLSKLLFTIGAQYQFIVGNNNTLTLGATYQPKAVNSARYLRYVVGTSNSSVDTISYLRTRQNITIPTKIAGGVFYQSPRIQAGFDYSWQDWSGAYAIPEDQDITLRAQQDYKIGFSYTPNRFDIRKAMNRWTYKIGARYSTSYMVKSSYKMHDVAFTLGLDFPLRRGSSSKVGMGIELGQRGHMRGGQVREQYFKYFLALSLFGDDYWFVRPRYN